MRKAKTLGVLLVGCAVTIGGCAASTEPAPTTPAPEPLEPVAAAELADRSVALLMAATESEDPVVRANAVEALSNQTLRLRTMAPRMLGDPNVGVRTVTALAIGKTRTGGLSPTAMQQLREMLRAESPYERAAAVIALHVGGARVDPGMLAELLLLHESPRVRANAAMVLGYMGDPSARPLLRQAAQRMPRRASEAELKLLELQLAESLLRLGDNSQVEVLRAALYPSRPGDLEATAVACQILGEVGDRGAVDELIFLVERQDAEGRPMPAEIRLVAVEALGKIGMKSGAFVARDELESDRPEIRAQAAATLGWTGEPGDARLLEPLLDSEDERMRIAAATSIARLLGR